MKTAQAPRANAVDRFAQALADLLAEAGAERVPTLLQPADPTSWRERFWSCPPDTRLGIDELCQALGRSKAWAYRLTRTKQIPFRKLDGQVVFRVGDIREWLPQREDVHVTPRLTVLK